MTPSAEATAETIQHAIGIVPLLIDDATWLHNEAYMPRGRDRDRPTRSYPLDPTNPDAVPGQRDDLGLPTDGVLRQYLHAAALVADSARLARRALDVRLGGAEAPRPRPARLATGRRFGPAVRLTVKLLDRVVQLEISTAPEQVRGLAWSSANGLIAAYAHLRAAQPNPEGKPYVIAHRRCGNCGEPHTEPDRGPDSECAACRMWRRRHDGQPRPYRRNAEAYKAKERRTERGEGHGNEDGGVQAGTYRGGVWVPHRSGRAS